MCLYVCLCVYGCACGCLFVCLFACVSVLEFMCFVWTRTSLTPPLPLSPRYFDWQVRLAITQRAARPARLRKGSSLQCRDWPRSAQLNQVNGVWAVYRKAIGQLYNLHLKPHVDRRLWLVCGRFVGRTTVSVSWERETAWESCHWGTAELDGGLYYRSWELLLSKLIAYFLFFVKPILDPNLHPHSAGK